MAMNGQRFLLLIIGLLFCVLGCTRERGDIRMLDDHSAPTEADVKASFENDVMPILAVKCALSGCHGENPQEGYDYRTYESFIAGGEHGPVFIPGDAEESEIVKEIVEGKMPPPESGLPTLSTAELQILKDWINQQEAPDHVVQHEHGEEDDMGDDHAADAMEEHEDMNDDH